jgi:GAF domain-containing protein/HAMP domain-containing protein
MWLLIGIGFLSYLIADLIWAYLENVLRVQPFPAISDLFYLLIGPFILAGLLSLPSVPLGRRERWQFILDLLTIMTATGMLMWHFVIQPTAQASAGDWLLQATSVAYPITDLMLVTGMVASLLRQSDRDTRATVWLMLLSMVFFVGSDVSYAYTSLTGTYVSGGWVDAGWNIAHLIFIFAALRQIYRAPESAESNMERRATQAIRIFLNAVIALAFLLTVYVGVRDFYNPNYIWLFAGAGLLLLLVIIRQVASPNYANYSLRAKLVAAFLIVTLVPMAILFFINNNATRRNLTENANQVLSGTALETAESLDNFFIENLTYVRSSAQLHIFVEYLLLPVNERPGSETEIVLYNDLRALARRDQTYITSISLMDKRGKIVADTTSSEVGENNVDLSYFTEPRDSGLPYVSPVLFDDENLSLIFSAPVRSEDGSIIGVLRIRYDAAILQQFVTAKVDGIGIEGGDIILLDENYVHLADSDAPELVLKSVALLPADQVEQLQAQGRLPNQPAEELSTNLPEFAQGLANISEQPIFAAETHPGGTELEQIAGASLKTQPWLIVVAQTQDVFLAPITGQTRTEGFTVLGITLLVVLAALAISQSISNPIVQLRNIANQIAGGDFEAQAPVVSGDETGQLADAFNNMTSQLRQSFADLDRRASELATVAEVGTATATILETDKLLQEVVNLTKERFHLYHSHIYLLDEARENLVLSSGAGEPGRQMMAKGLSIPLSRERSLVARAAREGKGVTVNDVTQAPDFLPNPLLPDTRSELAVPMLVGGKVIGVFDVQSDVAERFTESDINIQTTLASQVATSIQNVRSFESAQKIAADLAVVANVGIATSTITETGRLLQEAVELTKKSFNLYHAHIYLMNKAEDTLVLTAGAGEVGRKMTAEGRQIPLEGEQSLVARAAREGKGVTVNDVTQAPDFLPNPLLPETRSEMAVPMLAGGKVIGVLDVQSEMVNRFAETDISIQTTLASQVAAALQNARSFEQAQLQARREAELNLITQKIQGTTSIEAALKIATRELGRALNAQTSVQLTQDKN